MAMFETKSVVQCDLNSYLLVKDTFLERRDEQISGASERKASSRSSSFSHSWESCADYGMSTEGSQRLSSLSTSGAGGVLTAVEWKEKM